VRQSDGHLIVAAVSERDLSTSDHRVFDINGTGSITELTAITTDIDDHYYPAVFIDQITNDIFVAFNGLRTGGETLGTSSKVYYTTSSDDGTTWSAGSTAYMEGAAALVVQVWAPLMGPRFYVGWRVGSTIVGNKVNSVTFSGAPPSDVTGSDSATLSESTAASGLPLGVETFTVSEQSAVVLLTGSATDVFNLSEAAIGQLTGQDLVAVDTITLSESTVLAVLAVGVDSGTLTDTLTTLAATLTASQAITFAEAVTSLPVTVTAIDAAAMTDLASLQSGNSVSAADAFTMGESATVALVAIAAEALTLTEASDAQGFALLVDVLTLSESAASSATMTGIPSASSFVIRPRMAVNAQAGADTGISWDNVDITWDSILVTMDGGYLAPLPDDGAGISPAWSADVEVGV
jgi:hypothetical protein